MDSSLLVALITGLTTGGLSCLAVQGGLISGSIAQQMEASLRAKQTGGKRSRRARRETMGAPSRWGGKEIALPILVFLTAKLFVHALLGFLLGWAGSLFMLTPVARGMLQLVIGMFMIGNALRMFNVHPIFRYFTFEPPQVVRRWVRRAANQDAGGLVTPAFLGVITVLIPCGVTQAMMATAIATGSPVQGALLMFAFVLGTGPMFFGVTYLAARLGTLWEKHLTRVAAVAILLIGILAVDTGLNLTGSPVSLTKSFQALAGRTATVQIDPIEDPLSEQVIELPDYSAGSQDTSETAAGDEIVINVMNSGYEPAEVVAKANQVNQLKLVSNGVFSCSRAFVIPSLNIQRILPETGTETIEIAPQEPGTELQFTCSMGMYTGVILFQ